MTCQDHAGANWRITLPADWKHLRTAPDGVTYFESSDQRYGVYIAVWNVHDASRASDDLASEFLQAQRESLDAMTDHGWAHAAHHTGPGEALLDSLDSGRHYRVLCRMIARPPLVLRASFQDYDCRDLEASNRVLGPLLERVALSP